ncbi:MAG: LD-carboxypeptidase [Bacteroidales bacterium]|nr:LD-carboxypeptidase [Bacteroidales bacterium]MCK9499792.1 LD-carboxypeptidase [Bacteroidales bacterium]MDY0315201.1 LD-carboxypeptidase [Bacteroidales bacterium]
MYIPEKLNKGDKIAIISPAGSVNPEFVKSASNLINSYQFQAIVFPSCLKKNFQFAGKDEDRLQDLQKALDDENIKAILCSRGGYGIIRILNKLNFEKFLEKPKWIIGFSDITNLHLALNKYNVMSIHGLMTKAMHEVPETVAVKNIFKILEGEKTKIICQSHKLNKKGEVEAEIIGGNLSIIYSLQATDFEIDTDNKILFIEDLNEYLYHLDRMMLSLKLAKKFDKLKALIVGSFSDMKDNQNAFGKTAYEIIAEHIAEFDFPVCFNFPLGHINNNMPIVCGQKYKLEIADKVSLY